jgi:hypothetical protein
MKRFCLVVVALGAFCGLHAADWAAYRIYAPDATAIQRVTDSDLTLLSEDVSYTTDVAAPDEREVKKLGLRYESIGSIGDPTVPYVRETDGSDYRTEFLRYNEIIAQYEAWRAQYPTLVTRQQIGTSLQNRPIWVYRLRNPYTAVAPTGILIQGGIHAREWLSPPTVMYITDMMIRDGLGSAEAWNLLTRYEISVVPVVNPDGYEYTWTNNRLWRKNRRDIVGSSSFGVDLNRNYAVGWGGQGSSSNPGSDTYRGTAAFSEPEVACIRDYVNARSATMPYVFMVDYHTHGQKVLYPWSYTESPPAHPAQLSQVGNVYKNAMLASGGENYDVGQGSVALYVAGGTSKDFYYDEYGAWAYTVEMRAGGQSGFDPPPTTILPNAMENYAGFKAVLRDLL